MNKVILMGRLGRDPEIFNSENGIVAKFTLAVDRRFSKETDWINCVSFGKTAEFVQKWFKQGTKIIAEGRIQTGHYTNKAGQRVNTVDVAVENVEFAESKASNKTYEEQHTEEAQTGFVAADPLSDEGLPFS